MTQDQVLLTILGALVVANGLLVASILLRTRGRRRSAGQIGVPARPLESPAGHGDSGAAEDARVAAAIEAFVAGVSVDAPGRGHPPAPWHPIMDTQAEIVGPAPDMTVIPLQTAEHRAADDRRAWAMSELARHPITPESTPVELADPATWTRAIHDESARKARFGHPVTVVMAELPHFDILADRFGRGVADQVAVETARFLVSEGRDADRIAWLGDARFGVLLPETEESAAAGFVERVRAATDNWLESAGLSIRLSLGWAGSTEGGGVMAAAVVAEQRMRVDR